MKLKLFQHRPQSQQGFTIIELVIATSIFAIVILLAATIIIFVSKTYVKGQVESETQLTAQTILATISNDIKYNKGSSVIPSIGQPAATLNGLNGPFYFCIGTHAYVYQLDTELSSSISSPMYAAHNLIVYDDGGSCPNPSAASKLTMPATGGIQQGTTILATYGNSTRELLSANQRLGQLSVLPISTTNGVASFQVSITVAYGQDDILTDDSLSPSAYNTGARALPPITRGSPILQPESPVESYGYSCIQQSVGGDFCAVSSLTTVVTSRIN